MSQPLDKITKVFQKTNDDFETHAVPGNESALLNALINVVNASAVAATLTLGRGHKWDLCRLAIRPTTNVTNGASAGRIRVYKAAQGTAYASRVLVKEINITTAVLGADTTSTTEFLISSLEGLEGGDTITLEHVQDATATGILSCTVFAHEKAAS
jgi:hypothetical protein